MKPSEWMTFIRKTKRTGNKNLSELNSNNVALVLEYQTATPWRRKEIFQAYYETNEYWINRWPRWAPQHWAELTQIYVSLWHEAFMRYKRTSEKSVFNFYMENCWRNRATNEYISYLEKSRRVMSEDLATSFTDHRGGDERLVSGFVPKEYQVDPRSDYDKAILRSRLNRCLDTKDMDVFKEYVYGDRELNELMKDEIEAAGRTATPREIYARTNHFKRYRLRDIVDRLALFTSVEELADIISEDRQEHPLATLTKQSVQSRLTAPSRRKAAA